MKILITGGSGFVGSHLSSFFRERGHELIVLSQNPQEGQHFWDPSSKQIDMSILQGVEVVINLAGESILGRWNQKKMEKIRDSRLTATRFLCDTILRLEQLPKLYLNASAVGYYGDRGDEILTEESSPGSGFLAEVCQEWEAIPHNLAEKGVRLVLARFGLVLGEGGGALDLIAKPFKMGMGGSIGKGSQIMSWIAIDDLVHAIDFVVDHDELSGPINFVSPQPVTNAEFTKILAHVLNKPAPLPIPKFALSMLFGSGAEVFLASTSVKPERLLNSGFQFRYTDLATALRKYLRINT